MSIISTLALMASAVIARIRPPSLDDELAALQARLDDLNRRYDEHLANVTRQRDEWQGLAERFRDYALRQQAPNYGLQQQYQAQNLQNAQIQNSFMLGQSVFGAHNLGQQIDAFVCNCVPARHDMFLRG